MKARLIFYSFLIILFTLIILSYKYIFIPNYNDCIDDGNKKRMCIKYLIR